jgi:hypothetical protein
MYPTRTGLQDAFFVQRWWGTHVKEVEFLVLQ